MQRISTRFLTARMHTVIGEALETGGAHRPNPAVGAGLLFPDGRFVTDKHARAGCGHAEVNVIRRARAAGLDVKTATLFVSLEPCCIHGKTPPCTEAIIGAGIRRVVFGCFDPNPAVNGGGVARLRSAGIEVFGPVAEAAAQQLIEPFRRAQQMELPAYCMLEGSASSAKPPVPLFEAQILNLSGDCSSLTKLESMTQACADASQRLIVLDPDRLLTGFVAEDPTLWWVTPGPGGVYVLGDGKASLRPSSWLGSVGEVAHLAKKVGIRSFWLPADSWSPDWGEAHAELDVSVWTADGSAPVCTTEPPQSYENQRVAL